MKSKISRKLVIDASVARASGGPEASMPSSKRCRDFMLKAREVCHRIVMSPDLRAEWKRHQSNFARAWLVSMVSRRKFLFAGNCENAQLRQTLGDLPEHEWPVTKMLVPRRSLCVSEFRSCAAKGRLGATEALTVWSAAACRRFAPRKSCRSKSGSKLPHSKLSGLILPVS